MDLVAGGPEDDAGVVAVAADGVGGVAEAPLLKVEVIVVGVLGDGPAVEHLVHDEEAHAVGEVEEFGCERVVGSADGVDAESAEGGEAALPCGEGNGGAEGSVVDFVVDAVEEGYIYGRGMTGPLLLGGSLGLNLRARSGVEITSAAGGLSAFLTSTPKT